MAYTLQQLSDFEDIRTLKHRYYRGIDTADTALLDTLFADDVTVDYRGGGYRVTLSGRAKMIEFLASSFHSDFAGMHHGHMPDITLTGDDTAEGIWYLEDVAIFTDRGIHTSGSAITSTATVVRMGAGRSRIPNTTGSLKWCASSLPTRR